MFTRSSHLATASRITTCISRPIMDMRNICDGHVPFLSPPSELSTNLESEFSLLRTKFISARDGRLTTLSI